ncbi:MULTISPECIES: hypothetical protein [unclassified Microcoleus]|uniref:hypothetical protein n=1 Tax=unclassified Microcoleus TaxID=2642155 RepID=UPI002FD4B15F
MEHLSLAFIGVRAGPLYVVYKLCCDRVHARTPIKRFLLSERDAPVKNQDVSWEKQNLKSAI